MQCPCCQFENMPGLKRCARCQGLLDFSGIEVEPPRASGIAIRRRAHALRYRLVDPVWRWIAGVGRGVHHVLRDRYEVNELAVLACIIPGGGQIVIGQRRLGYWLLGCWGSLILASLVWIGFGLSITLQTLAIMLHAIAAALILRGMLWYRHLIVQIAAGILIVLLLQVCLYGPVRYLIHGLVTVCPIQRIQANDTVAVGDVLLNSGRWTRQQDLTVGELVYYRVRSQGGGGYQLRAGYGLDRIIARAGDHVVVTGGQLLVNSQRSAASPLNGIAMLPELDLTVSADHVCILPSGLAINQHGRLAGSTISSLFNQASLVAENDIEGVVLWRIRPYSRFGKVE